MYMVNRPPPVGALEAVIRPLCFFSMEYAVARPRPLPVSLVEKNGSNI